MIFYSLDIQFFAHKKGVGSSKNGRDSKGRRLGQKISDGQVAKEGQIIFRQRGTKIHPGKNVFRSKDDSLHAGISGKVKYSNHRTKKIVSVILSK